MRRLLLKKSKGFTIVELLIVVGIIGILAAIAIPNLRAAQKKSKYARAASDSKTAVTQGIIYSNDTNANPGTTMRLRTSGYANVPDADPWATIWVYSAAYASTATPPIQGELALCSRGPTGANACALPIMNATTGLDGEVGYSRSTARSRGRHSLIGVTSADTVHEGRRGSPASPFHSSLTCHAARPPDSFRSGWQPPATTGLGPTDPLVCLPRLGSRRLRHPRR